MKLLSLIFISLCLSSPISSSSGTSCTPPSKKYEIISILHSSRLEKRGTANDYSKNKLLGEGTFGAVYKAVERKTGRIVAIKTEKSGSNMGKLERDVISVYLLNLDYKQSICDQTTRFIHRIDGCFNRIRVPRRWCSF